MAKLTEAERVELIRVAKLKPDIPPLLTRKSAAAYVEFATFASRFARGKKPVRFGGVNWKL